MSQAQLIRTPSQNRAIHGLVGRLGRQLNREDADGVLRQICREASGQEHTSRLTVAQADMVIGALNKRLSGTATPALAPAPPTTPSADRTPWGPRGPGPRDEARISPTQQRVLSALFAQAGIDTAERRQAFSQRQCGKPWPQTTTDCDAVFEALSAMILRGVDVTDLLARAQALVGRPASRTHPFFSVFLPDFVAQLEARGKQALTTHKLRKLLEAEAQLGDPS